MNKSQVTDFHLIHHFKSYNVIKRILLFVLILFISKTSFSCINEFSINSSGDTVHLDSEAIFFGFDNEAAFDEKIINRWLKDYDLSNITQYSKEIQSDIAVQYLKLGEFNKALIIFQRLVKEYPEEYAFNSNLGTTYELLGENQLALRYIKKGLELNPESHDGSEWIHVKILEAKIMLEKYPTWWKKNKIVDFENQFLIKKEAIDEADYDEPLNDDFFHYNLSYEMYYQIRTRIPFVPVPDLTTSLLFKELAEYDALYLSTSHAYALALIGRYYAPNQQLYDELTEMMNKYQQITNELYNGVFGTDSMPGLTGYIDTTRFYDGKNGVNWLKVSKLDKDNKDIEAPFFKTNNNFSLSWLIKLLIFLIVGFISFKITRNRK